MSDTNTEPTRGSDASAISTRIVSLMHEYTGRGPTRARTYISGDLVSVVLMDTLTKAERNLVADGQSQLVLTMRKTFQHTMREELKAVVETVLQRQVLAFLSDNHLDPDVAVESFVLAPADDAT